MYNHKLRETFPYVIRIESKRRVILYHIITYYIRYLNHIAPNECVYVCVRVFISDDT